MTDDAVAYHSCTFFQNLPVLQSAGLHEEHPSATDTQQHRPSELHTIHCVSEQDSILKTVVHNKKKHIEIQTCATRTTNCDCRDLRARRL